MSRPNEKFNRRVKTDISDLFDDLPELEESEKMKDVSPDAGNTSSSNPPSEPRKIVQVNTAGSELFEDLPPIEIADGEIKDIIPEKVQLSAFAKDGQGDIELTEEELIATSGDSEEVKKKKLAQIMARRKSRKKEKREEDGLFGDLDDLEDLDVEE